MTENNDFKEKKYNLTHEKKSVWYNKLSDELTILIIDEEYCTYTIPKSNLSLLFSIYNQELVGIRISDIFNTYAKYVQPMVMNSNEHITLGSFLAILCLIYEKEITKYKESLDGLIEKSNDIYIPPKLDDITIINGNLESLIQNTTTTA